MRCAVLEGSDTCNFGTVSARCRLEVSGCITSQITDDAFIDIQIVIRLPGAGIHPGKRDLNCRVAIGTRVARGKGYREIKAVARESSAVAARTSNLAGQGRVATGLAAQTDRPCT